MPAHQPHSTAMALDKITRACRIQRSYPILNILRHIWGVFPLELTLQPAVLSVPVIWLRRSHRLRMSLPNCLYLLACLDTRVRLTAPHERCLLNHL
jgi:hypothetical protein